MNSQTGPKVSVAIITFNQKVYLEEAIESVLAQDYVNTEIVIADDGSTDGSHELLRRYEEQYPEKFNLQLGTRNLGISGNSNRALSACTGVYIAWLGGDDVMLPGRLSQQVRYMETHPDCSACFHNLDVFDSGSGKTLERSADTYPVGKFNKNGLKTIMRYGFGFGTSAMVRSTMAPAEGFNEQIPCASDWLYWIEVARRGRVALLPETLTRYRRHTENVTRDQRKLYGDLFRTIEMIKARYPELRADARYAEARLYYSLGVYSVKEKAWAEARRDLLRATGLSRVGWKWFFWYGRALLKR